MEEYSRPAKRVRQACDPCRRKKTRCPGEKPVCSYCDRLGQQCVYNENDHEANHLRHSQKMEERMDNLEGKMNLLIQQLLPITSRARQDARPSGIASPESCEVIIEPQLRGRTNSAIRRDSTSHGADNQDPWPFDQESFPPCTTTELVPDGDALREAIRLYFIWCHNQPISLFTEDAFLRSFKSRDHELLLALQALGLRFAETPLSPVERERVDRIARISRQRTMDCVINGRVKLSTLQSLCLLSIIDMADGRTVQASVNLAIASTLSITVPGNCLEGRNCMKSISILQHIQGCVLPGPNHRRVDCAAWPAMIVSSGRGPFCTLAPNLTLHNDGSPMDSLLDVGILKYTSQLSQVWHMARMYAACRVGPDMPPWDPQSDYSAVTQRHLEVDCSVPLKYRFAANKFDDQTPESLQKNRHYWGPWLFLQFVYAAIPCLLNHPFLLSMRLRNFRNTMPQSFIHQSFDLITRHAGWITYFIGLLDKKSFQPSDPALAHCVVIVATIHLQHSFVKEKSLREKSLAGFDKCVKFLRRMGSTWPRVSVMADNLDKLQGSVAVSPSSGAMVNEGHSVSAQPMSINGQLLWNMLIYERAGQEDAAADQSMLDDSLILGPPTTRGDVQDEITPEFDLVGSAGISGHRTVPKEYPVNPPDDTVDPPEESSGAPEIMFGDAMSAADAYRYLDGAEVERNYEGLSFQAQDFGRAIDDWMNIGLQ